MAKVSAGLLLYRFSSGFLEVFLVHPGGPFFRKKDDGFWTIPKGLAEEGEDLLAAAQREFGEETGLPLPDTAFIYLGEIAQKGGKKVFAWAAEEKHPFSGEIKSNYFEIEWPPNSGKKQKFPEIDKAAFFPLEVAKQKIMQAQVPFLECLAQKLTANE